MKKIKKVFKKGFSLIELSVVLIIIGLLMAAIMKGRDLIRSAEMKKFYNTFVKAWELAYTQYYDRTGIVLGGPLRTTKAEYSDFVGADVANGNFDFVFRNPDTIEKRAKEIGLELPETGLDKSYKYRVTFTDAPYSTVWVIFGSDPLRKDEQVDICLDEDCKKKERKEGKGNGRGNFMIMVNVPYDVAAQLDRIIDGKADGRSGNVICIANYTENKDLTNFNQITSDTYIKIEDYDNTTKCNGALGWGNESAPHVTLMYKLEI